jgi:hypothetical protein
MHEQEIDGNALIHAKRGPEKRFRELVEKYRKAGATDRQILNAMTTSRAMIDRIGPLSAMRTPRVRHNNKPKTKR